MAVEVMIYGLLVVASLTKPKVVHAMTINTANTPGPKYEIFGDHILVSNQPDSKPGSPEFPKWTQRPLVEPIEQWRVDLAERLVKAANASEAMEKCGSFLSVSDYTWCQRAMPQLGNPHSLDMYHVHKYEVDKNVPIPEGTHPDDLLGISLGIRDTDVWSMIMSNAYFVKTQLFDCYYKGPDGPMYEDLHGNYSKDKPCDHYTCYSTEFEKKKVCIDDHTEKNAIFLSEHNNKFYQPFSAALKGRANLSVMVKMDIEGSEWATLEKLLENEGDMAKIRSIDMETHLHLETTPKGHNVKMTPQVLTHHVEIMEKLAQKFMVTGSSIEGYMRNLNDDLTKERKNNSTYTIPWFREVYVEGGIPLDQYCISFVNRKLL